MDISTFVSAIVNWAVVYYIAVLVIANILLVIATWIAIIQTYRSRPIKLEVRKKHSDDLKNLVESWRKQMLPPEMVTKLVDKEPLPIKTLVEKDFLFSDLKNHMPDELNLFAMWEEYKKNLYNYNKRRYTLLQDIKQKTMGLISASGTIPPYTSTEDFCNHIYIYIFDAAEGRRSVYTNADYKIITEHKMKYHLEINPCNIAESGDRELLGPRLIAESSDREFIHNLILNHKDLVEELNDEAEFVKEAKELISLKEKLQTYKRRLEQEFDMYTRIPILPKNCKYIGWSFSGSLDTIKGKIKWILKKISKLTKYFGN